MLHPPRMLMTGTDSDLNNASIVLRVVYGDVSFCSPETYLSRRKGRFCRVARTYKAR